MKPEEVAQLIRYRLEQATTALEDANLSLKRYSSKFFPSTFLEKWGFSG